jgi:hypothetical protein
VIYNNYIGQAIGASSLYIGDTMIIRCNNPLKVFNRSSSELKALAISMGMSIKAEWTVDGFDCFHAESTQADCKLGINAYSECGACVNVNPRLWTAARGRVTDKVYLQK